MLGFLLGGLCLVGLIRTVRRARYGGYGSHHWGSYRWQGHIGRYWLRGLFERLDTTPAQEKAIVAAIEQFRSETRGLRDDMFKTRADVARSFGADSFDEGALFAAFATHDAVFGKAKDSLSTLLRTVHEVLNPKQREILASKIEGGFMRPHGGFGPYRAACAH